MTKLKIKNCAAFPLVRKKKKEKIGNPSNPSFPTNSHSPSTTTQADIDSDDLADASPAVAPTDFNNNTQLDYWQQPIDDDLLAISDDIPYLRQSTRNLRFHHPVDVHRR